MEIRPWESKHDRTHFICWASIHSVEFDLFFGLNSFVEFILVSVEVADYNVYYTGRGGDVRVRLSSSAVPAAKWTCWVVEGRAE